MTNRREFFPIFRSCHERVSATGKLKDFSVLLKFILSNQTFSRLKNLNLLLWKTGQTPSKKSEKNLISVYSRGQPVSVTVDCVFSSKSNSLSEAKDKWEDVRRYDISVQKLFHVLVNYGRERRRRERDLERKKKGVGLAHHQTDLKEIYFSGDNIRIQSP